jgi:hypothetical protein
LRPDRHGMGGADVGPGRHCRDVRGERDQGTGAGGPRAFRMHERHDRHGACKNALDDVSHGVRQTTGRVDGEDEAARILRVGLTKQAIDVDEGRGPDRTDDVSHDDRPSGLAARKSAGGRPGTHRTAGNCDGADQLEQAG